MLIAIASHVFMLVSWMGGGGIELVVRDMLQILNGALWSSRLLPHSFKENSYWSQSCNSGVLVASCSQRLLSVDSPQLQ